MVYEVRAAANKGLGLFAKQTIQRGTRILAERPLIALQPGQRAIDILNHAKRLDRTGKEALLALSWHPGAGIQKLGRWSEAFIWLLKDRLWNRRRDAASNNSVSKSIGLTSGMSSRFIRDLEESYRVLSVFRSNSFNLASTSTNAFLVSTSNQTSDVSATDPKMADPKPPPYTLALFPTIARINHSCIPNAQANYHPSHGTFNIHATTDIPNGNEVSINYLPEYGQLRDQRVGKLQEGYGFVCGCPACDLSAERGKRGEKNRAAMQDQIRALKRVLKKSSIETMDAGYGADGMPEVVSVTYDEPGGNPPDEIDGAERHDIVRGCEREVLEAMLEMYQAEGIVGREVASMYYHLARLQWSSGELEGAIRTTEIGLRLDQDCLGSDHPEYHRAIASFEGMKRGDSDGIHA